ncbi:hypothetical protein GGI19_004532 [Coemansia pectinata]|uniref:Uncharacterized protein n=1 Tax=Coemansia pectinata TaxID=1052879 RepID=A0A9W8GYI6_9FUNG|nr:hypothetical protein GGI19_004532 [Coemansia pectinata]
MLRQQEERPDVSGTSSRESPDLWDSSGSELTDLDSEYSSKEQQGHSRRRKKISPSTTLDSSSTAASASDPAHTGDDAAQEDASDSDNASASDAEGEAEEEPDLVLGQGKVMRLHRRVVTRNALLSQGLTESDATAYFDRVNKDTNTKYDGVWNRWVAWCGCQGVDPLKRSV